MCVCVCVWIGEYVYMDFFVLNVERNFNSFSKTNGCHDENLFGFYSLT